MEGRVCELLHEEDYSLEEVAGLLGVQQEFIRTNILTPNTQDIDRSVLRTRKFLDMIGQIGQILPNGNEGMSS